MYECHLKISSSLYLDVSCPRRGRLVTHRLPHNVTLASKGSAALLSHSSTIASPLLTTHAPVFYRDIESPPPLSLPIPILNAVYYEKAEFMSIENLKTFGEFATFPLLGACPVSPSPPTCTHIHDFSSLVMMMRNVFFVVYNVKAVDFSSSPPLSHRVSLRRGRNLVLRLRLTCTSARPLRRSRRRYRRD
jgi:hypothetical protein